MATYQEAQKRYEITEHESVTGGDFKLRMVDKLATYEKHDWATFDVSMGNYSGSQCFAIDAKVTKHYDESNIARSMRDSLSISYDHPQSIEWLTAMRDVLDRAILEARAAHGEEMRDPRFLRCNCDSYPIWNKTDLIFESDEAWRNSDIDPKTRNVQCPLCNRKMSEMPDAFKVDIGRGGLFATDASWLVAYNISEYYDSLDAFDTARGK